MDMPGNSEVEEPHFGGYYGVSSTTNILVAKSSTTAMLESIEAIRNNDVSSDVFIICDYGTADGETSIPVLWDSIKKIKETYGQHQVIQVIYEDVPENDFRPLFLRLSGSSEGCKSHLLNFSDVYVSAVGKSFYEQCLPPNSLHLGYSIMSMHWMSRKPCNITGAVISAHAKVESEQKLFAEQAARDWETILLHRAKELKRGGRFVSIQLCVEKDGSFSGRTTSETKDVLLFMGDILQDMVNSGKITEEECLNITIPSYMRTTEEYTLPFNDESSAVRKAGLKLISMETKTIKCAYHEKWLTKPGDSTQHAQSFVDGLRSWSNYSYFAGLSTTRPENERLRIVDDIFANMVKEISKDPSKYKLDHIHAHMVIEKM